MRTLLTILALTILPLASVGYSQGTAAMPEWAPTPPPPPATGPPGGRGHPPAAPDTSPASRSLAAL